MRFQARDHFLIFIPDLALDPSGREHDQDQRSRIKPRKGGNMRGAKGESAKLDVTGRSLSASIRQMATFASR